MSVGLYIPDNRATDDLLADASRHGFRPDHVAYFHHSIYSKRFTGDVDKKGFARLNIGILRQWIHPRNLGPILKHLVTSGVILTAPYSKGHFPTGYQIAPAFDGPPRRYVVEYAPMAKKLLAYRAMYKATADDPVPQGVIQRRLALLDHQRDSLAALSLPGNPADIATELQDRVDKGHVLYVCQCIEHHDHDGLTVCEFGWREHHLITRTSKHLRSRLLLEGHTVAEVDVANSQPMLLGILVQHHKELWYDIMVSPAAGASPSPSSCFWLNDKQLSRVIPAVEICSYLEACEMGIIYDLLAADCGLPREDAKTGLFSQVLFCKPCVCGRITKAFGRRWPSLLAWIQEVKRRHGYKALSMALQRLESIIMLDGVGNRILRELPGVPFLTIHDSVMLVANKSQDVKGFMEDEVSRCGARATIKVKGVGTGCHAETYAP
jgi:hypothetical protein